MTTTVEVGSPASLRAAWYQDEVLTDPASNAVTVTVTTLTGTVVAAAVTATRVSTGLYSWTMAARTTPDVLTLVWSATFSGLAASQTTRCVIVGSHYFTLGELRAVPGAAGDPSPLTETTKWPTAALVDARLAAQDEAEEIMGRSWVRRAISEPLVVSNGYVHPTWARVASIRAATDDLAATVTVTGWEIEGLVGQRVRVDNVSNGETLNVIYEHGDTAPFDTIARACMIRARHFLARPRANLPETTETYTEGRDGTFRVARPDGRSTGNAHVDAVYQRYSVRTGSGFA